MYPYTYTCIHMNLLLCILNIYTHIYQYILIYSFPAARRVFKDPAVYVDRTFIERFICIVPMYIYVYINTRIHIYTHTAFRLPAKNCSVHVDKAFMAYVHIYTCINLSICTHTHTHTYQCIRTQPSGCQESRRKSRESQNILRNIFLSRSPGRWQTQVCSTCAGCVALRYVGVQHIGMQHI